MGLFDGFFSLFSNKVKPKKEVANILFDTQLMVFQKLGFELNPGVDIEEITERWGNINVYEKSPFSILYMTLGETMEEDDTYAPITDRCWDFDTEAIEDHGAYIEIMKNLERISRGELTFNNLEDYVDIEENVAWVGFTINGDSYNWDLEVEDDWVAPSLFSKLADLTAKYNTKGRYTYFNTGGQNAVIGYETPGDLERIRKETGLNIEWLR